MLSEGITALFSLARFEALHTVDLSRGWFSRSQWYDVLTQIVNSSHPIEELNLAEAQLHDVELDLFGAAICNARKVNLSRLEGQHLDWENIFMKIENSSKIEQLDLSENLLAEIPVELFAGTLSKLDQVELKDALITDQQLQALISRSKETKTKLSANIICESLQETSPVHLASAFLHLQKVWLSLEDQREPSPAWLTVLQCLALSPVVEEVSLEGLSLDLTHLPPALLASSLARLLRLRLSGVELSGEQWRAVVGGLARLEELSLRMVNLSPLSPAQLARAVGLLTSLSLEYAVVTEEQWEAVLLSCCSTTSSLSSLTISYISLATITPSLIASLALTCSQLCLSHTALLPSQLELLLTTVPRSSIIRELTLTGLDLSGVEESVLARASLHLVRVGLRKTRLSSKQSTALLVANLGRSRLKALDLSNVNLSAVDCDLLALSLTRLREVDLSCTWLTKEQIVRLVNQVSKFTKLEFLKLQSATASLLNQEMKQILMKNLKLAIF